MKAVANKDRLPITNKLNKIRGGKSESEQFIELIFLLDTTQSIHNCISCSQMHSCPYPT